MRSKFVEDPTVAGDDEKRLHKVFVGESLASISVSLERLLSDFRGPKKSVSEAGRNHHEASFEYSQL